MNQSLITLPLERVESAILLIRGEKVILDSDLALLYGVETRALIQAVKRNAKRFPPDFIFQLKRKEFDVLISQFVISKGRGGRRHLPYAFTEHGALMAANVLNSDRAVQASVQVVRAFVKLRQMLASHADLARKLDIGKEIRPPIQSHLRRYSTTDDAGAGKHQINRLPRKRRQKQAP